MAQPYVGEIRMFAGDFAPVDWVFCDGQLLQIVENETLFQLIGTTYGGDGVDTFAVPDLGGRLPIHQGGGFVLAQRAGEEEIRLTVSQMPAHTHPLLATANNASGVAPTNQVLAASTGVTVLPYGTDQLQTNLSLQAISSVGGSQPHSNMQPYLCVSFIISRFGIYPFPT